MFFAGYSLWPGLIFLEESRRQSLRGGSSNGTSGTITFKLDATRWTGDSRLNWGKTVRRDHLAKTETSHHGTLHRYPGRGSVTAKVVSPQGIQRQVKELNMGVSNWVIRALQPTSEIPSPELDCEQRPVDVAHIKLEVESLAEINGRYHLIDLAEHSIQLKINYPAGHETDQDPHDHILFPSRN